jgi:transcriptional regulator with XRE-family HTH domain
VLDLDAFGELMRRVRIRRELRPIDLALEMGWSGTAPVYRYERGGPAAPRPDPDTVNLLAQVLNLDYADRILLLGLAGHIPDTEPLTPAEEATVLDAARPGLMAEANPAILFDFRWQILDCNSAYRAVLGLDEAGFARWRARKVTTLDAVWDPEFGMRASLFDIERVAQIQLLRFMLFNRLRRHEAWYRAYPACRSHLKGFAEAWTQAETMLAGTIDGADLSEIMNQETDLIDASGVRRRYIASQRNLHGAYGMVGMLVMVPAGTPDPSEVARVKREKGLG